MNLLIFLLLHPEQFLRSLGRYLFFKFGLWKNTGKSGVFKIKETGLKIDIDGEVVKKADKILAGEIEIYGNLNLNVGKNVDWHKDYVSGYEWSKDKFIFDIKYDYPKGTDIKNPWEMSRGHHLVTVSLAYKQTRDEKYAKYVMSQITDWIKNNKVYFGVNWKCTMEVGIRVCNWLVAYDLIREVVSDDFKNIFCESLEEHGDFIFNNLEDIGIKSNHYMSDIVGLVWLGVLCPQLKKSKKWLGFGIKEVEKEVKHQFYMDGINFEGSINYHRLVFEMLYWTRELLNTDEIKIIKAREYLEWITKVDGSLPQFGDNDSGIFLPIKTNYKIISSGHKYFEKGKVFVYKDSDWYLTINMSDVGQDGNGGHNHNDVGSFELSLRSNNLVVDPGTGIYTANAEIRNRFRSAAIHNLSLPKGYLDDFSKGLFVGSSNRAKMKKFDYKNNKVEIEIEFGSFVVKRNIEILKDKIIFEDELIDNNNVELLLTLDSKVDFKKIKFNCLEGTSQLVDGKYSPSYSKIIDTKAIKIIGNRGKIKFEFKK